MFFRFVSKDIIGRVIEIEADTPAQAAERLAQHPDLGPHRESYNVEGTHLCAANLNRLTSPVPVVPQLNRKLYEIVKKNPDCLNMAQWHTCKTTHCIAGWHVELAGRDGSKLEDDCWWFCGSGPLLAGALIFMASCPGKPVPDFFVDEIEAERDLAERAHG